MKLENKASSLQGYILSVFITAVGNSITFIVCGKYSLDLFGLASVFGGLLLIEQFKSLVLSPLSGRLIDKYSSKKMAVFCDFACFFVALVCSLLSYFGHMKVAIIGVMFFVNLIKPFYNTSIFSLVRLIATEEQLFKINSRTAVAQQLGSFVGFSLAAYLVIKISVSWLLLIDAFSYLLSAVFLFSCREINKNQSINMVKEKSLAMAFSIKKKCDEYQKTFTKNKKIIILSIMIGLQINIIIAYNTTLFKLVAQRFPDHPSYLSFLEIAYSLSIVAISLGIEKIRFLKLSINKIKIMFLVQGLIFLMLSINLSFSTILILVSLYGGINSLVFPVLFTELYTNTPVNIVGRIGGIKGSIQAIVAIPLLLTNSFLIDYYGLHVSYQFIAMTTLIMIFLSVLVKKYDQLPNLISSSREK